MGPSILTFESSQVGCTHCFELISSLCFVCAHLAAHRENVAGRNSDFNDHGRKKWPEVKTSVLCFKVILETGEMLP